jgi:hypothetical protein
MHEFLAAKFPQVGDGIRKTKDLGKDIEEALRRGIDEYKRSAKLSDEKPTAKEVVK